MPKLQSDPLSRIANPRIITHIFSTSLTAFSYTVPLPISLHLSLRILEIIVLDNWGKKTSSRSWKHNIAVVHLGDLGCRADLIAEGLDTSESEADCGNMGGYGSFQMLLAAKTPLRTSRRLITM
jgi:hypothetical protein